MFYPEYQNYIANAGADYVGYISLVDSSGNEVTNRQAVTWDRPPADEVAGTISLQSDMVFTVPAGEEIKGWRGWQTDTSTTELVGEDIFTEVEKYINEGEFTLLAEDTKIVHEPKS